MQEMWVRSLDGEDPQEKEMATHFSIFAWEIPWTEELGGPVVSTLPSKTGGVVLVPGRGTKVPHALWPKKQNIKQNQYYNKFKKGFKKWSSKKKSLKN